MPLARVNIPAQTAVETRAHQLESCVASATQALVQRGRVSELIRGQRRRGTAYVYRRTWADFAAFLAWRLGDDTLQTWASATDAERGAATTRQLDYLDARVGRVATSDVHAYVEALLQRPVVDRRGRRKVGLENSTLNGRLAALRYLFRTAIRMKLRDDNPADAEHVDRRRVTSPYRPHGLTREQAAALLAGLVAAPDAGYLADRDRVLILLLLRLGLRREEACELRADAVQAAPASEGGLVLDLVRKGDRHEALLVPLDVGDELVAYVERWGLVGYLFLSCPLGVAPAAFAAAKPMRPDDVTWAVRSRTHAAFGTRLGPHVLRHTFVTSALDAGAALHEVQRYVGHESPATTERYVDRRTRRSSSPAEKVRY